MIHNISIRNFRCFENFEINKCSRINLIVGDNGSGKTALLEAIFLALGTTPELGLRFRQQRGLEGSFSGSLRRIEEAIWRDFFYNRDWNRTISIELEGDGPENRSVNLFRGRAQLSIPLTTDDQDEDLPAMPICTVWRDSDGDEHKYFPKVTKTGLQFEGGDEDNPDFLFFAANQTVKSVENAERFSDLSRSGRLGDFVEIIVNEYKWIKDIGIEVVAGAPVIYATTRDIPEKIPLANISGGINKIVGIMLGIASRNNPIILVDEIENGLYFKHQKALWRGLLNLARRFDSQLFLSTHSEEWLEALVAAANGDVDDISLWRLERSKEGPTIYQFSGAQAAAGIRAGEVR